MPGLLIDGAPHLVAGLAIANYRDDPTLRLDDEDRRPRRASWVRALTLHTTAGLPKDPGDPRQNIKPGLGPHTRAARRINGWWKKDGRCAGAHLLVDFDGSVSQLADLQTETTFHAGPVNDVSIGIEIAQDPNDASLYDAQLEIVADLVDALTRLFRIQRQIPRAYRGLVIPRLSGGGIDVVGVYGHRDVTTTRGQGDPGDEIFGRLKDRGYEVFDFLSGEDKVAWTRRQREFGLPQGSCDGVPGRITVGALAAGGRPHGLFVERPGDR